ncbi:MAG: hypothetical protein AAF939_06740, partial [Planctomycetota bacterium]
EFNEDIDGDGLRLFEKLDQLQHLEVHSIHWTDTHLKCLKNMTKLQFVDFSRCAQITAEGLSQLSSPQILKSLKLKDCPRINSAAMATILKCSEIEVLNLDGTAIRPDSLREISKLNNLRFLDLSHCKWLDDSTVKMISGLANLEVLYLADVPLLTDQSLTHLQNLSSLRKLKITRNENLDLSGFSTWNSGSRLDFLELGQLSRLGPTGLENLAGLSNLQTLVLRQRNISIEMLSALHGVSNLITLELEGIYDSVAHRRLLNSLPKIAEQK